MSQHPQGPCSYPCRVIGCTEPCDGSAGWRHFCAFHRSDEGQLRPQSEQDKGAT